MKVKRRREDFESELETLGALKKELSSGITMKGALVSYALLHGGKNIENRTKKITPGWYAIHTGSGQIDPSTEEYVIINLKKVMQQKDIPREKDLPHGAIVGAMHISGGEEIKKNRKLEKNGWAIGPVCNFVDKTVAFESPIKAKGAITLGWSFDSIDKRNGEPVGSLRGKVAKEIEEKCNKVKEEIEKLGSK